MVTRIIILVLLFSVPLQKSYAVASASYIIVNGIEIKKRSVYQYNSKNALKFDTDGELYYNGKKVIVDGIEDTNKYFSVFSSIYVWPASFSPSLKYILFLVDYKKPDSHAFILDSTTNTAYDVGPVYKHKDLLFLGWRDGEKEVYLMSKNNVNQVIKIDTEAKNLDDIELNQNFVWSSYLQTYLGKIGNYLYVRIKKGEKIKTSCTGSNCANSPTYVGSSNISGSDGGSLAVACNDTCKENHQTLLKDLSFLFSEQEKLREIEKTKIIK